MVNITMLVGRIGKDGELAYTKDGTPVMRLRIATNEYYIKDGERQERTEWHTVIVWGKKAEVLSPHAVKGRLIFVQGPIRYRTWQDSRGTQHTTAEIIAETIRFLDRSKKNQPPEDEDDDQFPF